MTGLIAVLALAAIVFWLFGGKRAPREPAPEDDVTTPVDEDELADAEAELADAELADAEAETDADDTDPGMLPDDDDDDWGPGAGQR